MTFALAVRAHPMKQDASIVRVKLMERLPVGSSQADIDQFLGEISSNGRRRLANCDLADSARICRFPIRKSIWFEEGFELRFVFGLDERLADVRVARL